MLCLSLGILSLAYLTSGQKINPVIFSEDYKNFVPGIWTSLGTGGFEEPPMYIPPSQEYVYTHNVDMLQSEFMGGRKSHKEIYDYQMTRQDFKNCVFCDKKMSGLCQSVPSCLHCVVAATVMCSESSPCLRCSVIRNPFFLCKDGEKFMDQHNSCRCVNSGRSGWCTDTYNMYNELELAATFHSSG